MPTDLPLVAFATQTAWDAFLAKQKPDSKGVWLKLAKKDSGVASVSKADAIATALCHGWIDGQIDKFDDDYFLTRFTPRRLGSKWSANNRATALKMIEAKRMRPRGLAEIEAAKKDGRWDGAYASASSATVPDDLAAALARNAKAKKFFDTLTGANRYAILYRVHDAKKPATRAARIEKFVAMCAAGETVHGAGKKKP
ncbi:YdeI/OmpD-associated family protein [Roseiterribacter gracilis]|uniref:Bacteriocin-protection protein n=1 Tax=Roseiterribacter gracilis TaxID=2812848 RepID=A0A8S8XAU3_9PROT|nr:hypothetical protein TMPK1_12180 [Rhodospirillales bacterium TMPK1]